MSTRKRKLWATTFPRLATPKDRHESRAAVYRYLHAQAANWLCGALRSQYVTVWVDERDGAGWCRFEDIDLAEFGGGETEKP